MIRGAGVVEETPWWLEVNGARVAGGTMKPDHAREMAVGRLLADGWIRTRADITALELGLEPVGCLLIRAAVRIEVARAAEQESAHRRQHGCGLLHFVACDPGSIRRVRTLPVPPQTVFPDLFRQLFAAADRASSVGGIHAAALSDGRALHDAREDVGRHNAVDKAIGAALLNDADAGGLGLLVTSRISAEIALKAARYGLAWVASRSIPTSLAVAFAEVAGMPLIARAPASDAVVMGSGGAS